MKRITTSYCCLIILLALLHLILQQAGCQPFEYPTASLSTSWTADHNGPHNVSYHVSDGSFVKAILLRSNPAAVSGPSFACGFYCKGGAGDTCALFLFTVFILYVNGGGEITYPLLGFPQVVWSANRERPVRVGATLELTADGDLLLRDGGSTVWSTGTSGRSVVGMSLEPSGNLRLVDRSGATVWQSFDHPSDVLLSGQVLSGWQRLVANVSASNWTPNSILYLDPSGAYADASPPQSYYIFSNGERDIKGSKLPCHLKARNETLVFVANSTSMGSSSITSPPPSPLQFLRFESDGHLRLREWVGTSGWASTIDVFDMYLGDCAYPTVCGSYGICSDGKERCKCPAAAGNGSSDAYFRAENSPNIRYFCNETIPLTCKSPEFHQFLSLQDVSYFGLGSGLENKTTQEGCKNACLKNCSCKAAIFHFNDNASDGYCYLPTKLFSLMTNLPLKSHYNSTTFLKIQTKNATEWHKSASMRPVRVALELVVVLAVGSLAALVLMILAVTVWLKKKKKAGQNNQDEAIQIYQLPGIPRQFTYEELTRATNNFTRCLGKGGFAKVFEGVVVQNSRRTKVAVKRLERVQQSSRDFLAEVRIISRIRHVNLVEMVGFCIEKSHRMLVYEYMHNGSLRGWIFDRAKEGQGLSWEVRRNIIHQVAKALLYLHEECNPKIVHLDIKPDNILLDDDFNAKVSDFGVSELIYRNQICTRTAVRGTFGYQAPEWLENKNITDKLDVYSFGVVLLEVVCLRRNLDHTRKKDEVHLLKVLNDMVMAGQLDNFIGSYCYDMDNNELAMKMLKLVIWCLQYDAVQRPSMSQVVKVLEEASEVPDDVKLDFISPANIPNESSSSIVQEASILSGPR